MANNSYKLYYSGLYIPYGSTTKTTAASITDGNIARGATQIKVANVALFTKGGRYMLLSDAPATDWHNNRNQYSNTYMGAGGTGQWANLDADEAPFEFVLVTDVNVEASTLTLQVGTCYSYTAGALIGECIRCHVGQVVGSGGEEAAQFTGNGNAIVWHHARNDRIFTYNPAHRIRWRCMSAQNFRPGGTVDPWNADFSFNSWAQEKTSVVFSTGTVDWSPEPCTGSQFLTPMGMRSTGDTDWRPMGSDPNRRPGIIRDVRHITNIWNAINEDTIKVQFQGTYQTFRLFYNADSTLWFAIGPETD
jgi:hypothetical protein